MKRLVRFLLLASFASVVLVAMAGGPEWLIVLGFFIMFALVGVNFFMVYGIRVHQIEQVLEEEQVLFSTSATRFCSMADAGLPRTRAQTQRGRLVVTPKALRFFVKQEHPKGFLIKETFKLDIGDIEAVGLGQVLSSSSGLIVSGTKNREGHFAVIGMEKKYPDFKRALGWEH